MVESVGQHRDSSGKAAPGPASVVSLVFPVAVHRVFSYVLPQGMVAPPAGVRVLAPLGRRRAVGFVLENTDAPPAGVELRPIQAVLDPEPLLPPAVWSLARWISSYYVAPLGLVLHSIVPARLLRVRSGRSRGASGGADLLAPPARTYAEALVRELPAGLERRAAAQARALGALIGRSEPVEVDRISRDVRVRRAAVEALERAGLARLSIRPLPVTRGRGAAPRNEAAHALTADQVGALEAIQARAGDSADGAPRPVLLHGVTGSGKTLVYLKAVESALAQGRSAIVLVPEIALTPRAAARFREAFGDRVALLHSALSEGERWEAWRAMRAGEVAVAVGPRSAVFSPLREVGAIVIDEEHEASYKQEEAPRYHARDVAIVRGRLERALVVLGSATPSLESYANAESGKYARVSLPRRVAARELPAVEVVDMRGRPPPERMLSRPLREALAAALERREQSLLLLNRRGFSAFVQCVDCGAVPQCPDCRITLTLHRPRGTRAGALRCHYCGHREAAPDACAACGGPQLAGRGQGTQQVEEHVAELFPTARVARMDRDTTARRGSHQRLVEAMERGEIDVLVGTQMVAKGHDFPGLALVGVVSADTGLNVPDFRAAERTFQLVAQVAGRPGRGPAHGRVLVQTYVPEHPAIRAAARHDYAAFYGPEVQARFEVGYPPAVKLASCLLTGRDEGRVGRAAADLANALTALARGRALGERLSVLGPSPAPLARLRKSFRWHLLVKSTSPALLQTVLQRLATRWRPPRGVQLAIDRDPYGLM